MYNSAGNTSDKHTPMPVLSGLNGVKIVQVECGTGDAHTLALDDTGKVQEGRAGGKGGEGVHVHVPFMQALEVVCCIYLNKQPSVYFLLGAFYLALI